MDWADLPDGIEHVSSRRADIQANMSAKTT
jgi:hypothetical protein